MQTSRWSPPGFLVPSWSSFQLKNTRHTRRIYQAVPSRNCPELREASHIQSRRLHFSAIVRDLSQNTNHGVASQENGRLDPNTTNHYSTTTDNTNRARVVKETGQVTSVSRNHEVYSSRDNRDRHRPVSKKRLQPVRKNIGRLGDFELQSRRRSNPQQEVDQVLQLEERDRLSRAKAADLRPKWRYIVLKAPEESRNDVDVEKHGKKAASMTTANQVTRSKLPPGGFPSSRIQKSKEEAKVKSYVSLDDSEHEQNSIQKIGSNRGWGASVRSVPGEQSETGGEIIEINSEPEKPLLEELFPELVNKQSKGLLQTPREVPRLQLDELSKFDYDQVTDLDDWEGPSAGHLGTKIYSKEEKKHVSGLGKGQIPLLVLRTSDTLLSEADFSRIQPRGSHIEEWRGRGSYLSVIPIRNAQTLSPIGHYLLMFRNEGYRAAYKANAERLAQLCSRYTPGSLESPGMSPYPGMIGKDGEDVGTLLSEYALTPPGRGAVPNRRRIEPDIFWHETAAGSSKLVQRLVANRGYDKLAGRAGRCVLFWVDGYLPVDAEIRRMLRWDGRNRGIAWSAAGRVERFTIARNVEEDDDQVPSMEEDSGNSNADKRKTYDRWILEFESETEARRFVRTWHLKQWPQTRESGRLSGDVAAHVHADFLW